MTKEDIKLLLPEAEVLEMEPMSRHTTFKVGGPARLFVSPSHEAGIVKLVNALLDADESFEIIGRGSNLLVSDKGYDGVIVCIKNTGVQILADDAASEDALFYVPAGESLISLSAKARDMGFSGLEFACGIPGTVGGAIVMNAGAYGGEISQVIESVRVIKISKDDRSAKVIELSREQMKFGYRTSLAMEEGIVVLGATFALKRGDKEEIAKKMQENLAKRSASQPLEFPNAGSTFKRPEGDFAGRLIEEAGLKGYSEGGAQVSLKHAGFVINTGDATASDILALCDHIIKTVFEKFGVKLELEIRMVGF